MTEIKGREITTHVVNPANDTLRLFAVDPPGIGGANHQYTIRLPQGTEYFIDFQNGPIAEVGVNGLTHEVLIAIVEDRLRAFQSGPYANEFNAKALESLVEARKALQDRTRERMARGVEGTHNV